MKFTFTTLAYPHLRIEEVLGRARKFGLDAIELRVADDGIHLKPHYPIDRSYIKIVEESGVRIASIAGYARFSAILDEERRRNEDLLKVLVLMAEELGAKAVRVYAGKFPDDVDSSIRRIAESLNRMAEHAYEHNVYIAIETHDELTRVRILLRLLERLDPNIRIVYDVANMIMVGEKHEEVFPLIADRIVHVHIKDFIIVEGKRVFVRPGEGIVPICRVVNDLKSRGYKGYISIEWEKMWHPDLEDPDTVIPLYIDFMKGCLNSSNLI
ncbi:MAG: sugar phosphate isomerase/epimerase [Ignisphaera sp.]|nr:sugar phosphate isomerase/epimerase [Ignisphaera sp.]MCX8167755.1 sugar phosphate isomerase/epimerase [Ignisphaera sp.]MDW8085258.1 sugar phosphate isomerase/epimerase family protein [Ignisphaera sp.]